VFHAQCLTDKPPRHPGNSVQTAMILYTCLCNMAWGALSRYHYVTNRAEKQEFESYAGRTQLHVRY